MQRKIILFLSLLFILSIIRTEEAMPILISSSKKISPIDIFTDQTSLIKQYTSNIVNNKNSKIIIFDIQTPHSLAETTSILRNSQFKFPSFSKVFVENKDVFQSSYILYDSADFVQELQKVTNVQCKNYDIYSNFMTQHTKDLQQNKNSIELITTPLSSMEKMDKVLEKDLENLQKFNVEDYTFIVLFSQQVNNYRLLEGDNQVEESQVNNAVSQDNFNILSLMKPSGLFGLLVSLLLIIILYVASGTLLALESPQRFAKFNMIVGRES